MNKKNEKPFQMTRKGAAVGLVICFVAVIAIVGTYTFNNYQKKLDEQIAQAEEMERSLNEASEPANTNEVEQPKDTEENQEEEISETEIPETADTSGVEIAQAYFTEDSTLAWPASGAVLIGYSMDKTTYFSTLDQYRYNPAMIIGGEIGEQITASAPGTVKAIDQQTQTGITVTLDMGNGYEAIYGQLKELSVQEGQYLSTGDAIGYLSEPTKYYAVEGPNLYFEILKDGEPVNPAEYMGGEEAE